MGGEERVQHPDEFFRSTKRRAHRFIVLEDEWFGGRPRPCRAKGRRYHYDMPPSTATDVISVDAQAAEILRRVSRRAAANGQTLGQYLSHALGAEALGDAEVQSFADAWHAFVGGMTDWTKAHLPPLHVVDDSRDSMYDDRS